MRRAASRRISLAVLVTLAVLGASSDLMADVALEAVEPTPAPAQEAQPAPSAAQPAQAVQAPPPTEAPLVPGTPAAAGGAEPVPEKPPEPVTGAFGITLGAHFEPDLVEKVLSEEPKRYRIADKSERTGTLYRVEPKDPDPNFTAYTIETTEEGTIYRIDGEFVPSERASKCALTKEIAAALKEKYGKPRGKGNYAEWYNFRDLTAEGYRGIRLNAVRCRRGHYSITYEDATFTIGPLPAEAQGAPKERKRTWIMMSDRPGRPGKGPEPGLADEPTEAAQPAEAPEPGATAEPAPSIPPAEPPEPSEPPTPAGAPGT